MSKKKATQPTQYGLDRNGAVIHVSPEMIAFPKIRVSMGVRLISAEQAAKINAGTIAVNPAAPPAPPKPSERSELEDSDLAGEGNDDGDSTLSDEIDALLKEIDAEKDKERLEAIGLQYGANIDRRRSLEACREQVKNAVIAVANGEADTGEGEGE